MYKGKGLRSAFQPSKVGIAGADLRSLGRQPACSGAIQHDVAGVMSETRYLFVAVLNKPLLNYPFPFDRVSVG